MSSDYVPAKTAGGMDHKDVKRYDNAADLLANTSVRDIMVGFSQLVDVEANECILDAFTKITEARVLSVPVYDDRRQKYIGFLDLVDIVHHFLETLTQVEASQGYSAFKARFSKIKCKDVMDLSGRNPYNPVADEDPLGAVISMMNEAEVHRVPVVDDGGELVSLLSQSRIVAFLTNHVLKIPYAHKTMEELHLGLRPVVSVIDSDLTVKGFELIRKEKISGIGMVNAAGELKGVLSVTDLRSIGYDDKLFQRLYMPVGEFLELALESNPKKPKTPIVISPQDTLAQVLDVLAKTGLHRLYIVDEARKPIGIVSLTDIIRLFA